MFGRHFFGRSYYGPRYWGDGGSVAPPVVVATSTDTGGGGPVPRGNYYHWAKHLDDAARETAKQRKKQFAALDDTITKAVEALFEGPETAAEVAGVKAEAKVVRADVKALARKLEAEPQATKALVDPVRAKVSDFAAKMATLVEELTARRQAQEALAALREEDDLAVLLLLH